ncbi:hypothetical protein [Bacillus sp. AFS017336]|uniref:hypothetical protein n=1 Tax=Bacillus sp. AFS017336 TaxID=2033489 RepID=UPI001155EF92|nr:hypothetical protein [Bacillus sp. AFS017336]
MKKYRSSWLLILLLFTVGGIILAYLISTIGNQPIDIYFFADLLFGLFWISCGIWFFKTRINGKGIYYDEEGVVINFKGNKISWQEIEEIKKQSYPMYITYIFLKNDVVETIRIRHRKKSYNKCFSIYWFMISKPRKMHKEIMKCWEIYIKDNE